MAEADSQQPAQQFAIQRIYAKDLSLETPGSPTMFLEKWEPQVSVDLNTQATRLNDEGVFEVVLTVTVVAKAAERTVYLVEVKQAGIFSTAGFSDQELGHLLGSYCPNVLFPYAREAVSDLVNRTTFPPLILNPINFDALYARHLEQQQQSGQPPVH